MTAILLCIIGGNGPKELDFIYFNDSRSKTQRCASIMF
jgi:hypothetical protein